MSAINIEGHRVFMHSLDGMTVVGALAQELDAEHVPESEEDLRHNLALLAAGGYAVKAVKAELLDDTNSQSPIITA